MLPFKDSFTQLSSLVPSPKATRSFRVRDCQRQPCQAVAVEIVDIDMCQLDMFMRQQIVDEHLRATFPRAPATNKRGVARVQYDWTRVAKEAVKGPLGLVFGYGW